MKHLRNSVNLLYITILTGRALSLPNSYPHPIDPSPSPTIDPPPTASYSYSDSQPPQAPAYTPPIYTGAPASPLTSPPPPPYYPTTTNPPAPPPTTSYPNTYPASTQMQTLAPATSTSTDCPDPIDDGSTPSSTTISGGGPSSTVTASNAILIVPPTSATSTPTTTVVGGCKKCCPHLSLSDPHHKEDWLMSIGKRIAEDLIPVVQAVVEKQEAQCGLIEGKGAHVVGCETFAGGVVCGWKWEVEGGVGSKWNETWDGKGWDEPKHGHSARDILFG